MIDPTKKLNILSLEELKGEIKSENISSRGEHRSPEKNETEQNSEKFFIEKKSHENENHSPENILNENKNKNTSIEKHEIKNETKINPKNSFIENKKKEKISREENRSPEKLTPNKDLEKINKTKERDFIHKTEKTKNTEKIYINIQEASKISGLSNNTIRKSLKNNELSYFFEKGKYSMEMEKFLKWIFQSQRKINIIKTKGIGKYIETWKI